MRPFFSLFSCAPTVVQYMYHLVKQGVVSLKEAKSLLKSVERDSVLVSTAREAKALVLINQYHDTAGTFPGPLIEQQAYRPRDSAKGRAMQSHAEPCRAMESRPERLGGTDMRATRGTKLAPLAHTQRFHAVCNSPYLPVVRSSLHWRTLKGFTRFVEGERDRAR